MSLSFHVWPEGQFYFRLSCLDTCCFLSLECSPSSWLFYNPLFTFSILSFCRYTQNIFECPILYTFLIFVIHMPTSLTFGWTSWGQEHWYRQQLGKGWPVLNNPICYVNEWVNEWMNEWTTNGWCGSCPVNIQNGYRRPFSMVGSLEARSKSHHWLQGHRSWLWI